MSIFLQRINVFCCLSPRAATIDPDIQGSRYLGLETQAWCLSLDTWAYVPRAAIGDPEIQGSRYLGLCT